MGVQPYVLPAAAGLLAAILPRGAVAEAFCPHGRPMEVELLIFQLICRG